MKGRGASAACMSSRVRVVEVRGRWRGALGVDGVRTCRVKGQGLGFRKMVSFGFRSNLNFEKKKEKKDEKKHSFHRARCRVAQTQKRTQRPTIRAKEAQCRWAGWSSRRSTCPRTFMTAFRRASKAKEGSLSLLSHRRPRGPRSTHGKRTPESRRRV